ncbi:DUF19 domain-containing protein [Caenorhabditis elegans]|uniref:DUF19 domain-containing protein n=1 Tax=Caenorhabditis elegans TaxID=6239 RepID=Q95Y74_CAEEL|nr:DUF19 domain-containing protein [Caenorhabditis elegans]CCD73923.1 DUF19 domain-containing protein [Caenorhabditis elegans]|eukprot:NP_497344.1 Uncharacterized protein CELE_Y119D3B.13 [Caenorhabditis elegans]
MRKILLFFAIFGFSLGSSQLCISKTLTFCQYGFNQNLNITSATADWTNPGTLSFIIRSYYLQGIDGLLSVCNARQQFDQCLGDQYDACMSRLNFITDGESPADATAYVSLFKTMEFDCDGGFIQSSRNWGCIAAVLQTHDQQLNDCRKQYDAEILKTPSSLCQASADFETCVRSQYSATCGPEVSWWACERTRRGLLIDSDCPSDSCSLVAQEAPGSAKSVFQREPEVAHVIRSILEQKD